MRLSRIEKGDKVSEQDRALVDALAEELALGEEDLAIPPRWVWIKPQGDRFTFVALGMRQVAFSSPEKAFAGRDILAHRGATPFADAQAYPDPRQGAHEQRPGRELRPGSTDEQRDFLLPLDPGLDDLGFLWALQLVPAQRRDAAWRAVRRPPRPDRRRCALRAQARVSRVFEAQAPSSLHALALRRLQNPPPEGAHLLEGWKREERVLFVVLERIQELRREHRAAVLER